MMQERQRHYWAFCANPLYYRIMDAVHECIFDSWNIPRGDVRAGDRAIIWKAKGRDAHRGIVALAEVRTDPEVGLDPNRAYWVDPHGIDEPVPRVTIRYLVPPTLPLWQGDERAPAALDELSVARATGGSVFVVSPEQWDEIMRAVGGWPARSSEVEAMVEAIEQTEGKARPGQGFRVDPIARRAVELHAMDAARGHYEARGWHVTNVSATQSYDLHCLRDDGTELRIEVKGTTSDGAQILLTRHEVEHARRQYPQVALYILAHIELDMTGQIPRCSGGHARVIEPWQVEPDALEPIAYAYTGCAVNLLGAQASSGH